MPAVDSRDITAFRIDVVNNGFVLTVFREGDKHWENRERIVFHRIQRIFNAIERLLNKDSE